MRYLLTFVFVILFTTLSFSATINVPADQPTIQAGIEVLESEFDRFGSDETPEKKEKRGPQT